MNTWQEISIDNLAHNLQAIKQKVGKDTKILAIVKANAYGHGVNIVASELEALGVNYFGVATVAEAIELRELGIKGSLVVLGAVFEEESVNLEKYNIIPTISDIYFLDLLHKRIQNNFNVHIKIDTGMGRYGILSKDIKPLIEKLKIYENICVQGIYSHFSTADDDIEFAKIQLGRFKRAVSLFEQEIGPIPYKHIANSSGILHLSDSYFNMVRPGLVLYGIYPERLFNGSLDLQPVMQWKSKIAIIKKITIGQGVSYGQTFVAKKDMRIAVLPVGYSHGLDRVFSNNAQVLVRGSRANIIGRICMDQTIIDISDVNDIEIGDEVVLIGKQQGQEITVFDMSTKSKKIPYEILCGIKDKIGKTAIVDVGVTFMEPANEQIS